MPTDCPHFLNDTARLFKKKARAGARASIRPVLWRYWAIGTFMRISSRFSA